MRSLGTLYVCLDDVKNVRFQRQHGLTVDIAWMVLWRSGTTLVFDRQAFAVLRSTCSWRV